MKGDTTKLVQHAIEATGSRSNLARATNNTWRTIKLQEEEHQPRMSLQQFINLARVSGIDISASLQRGTRRTQENIQKLADFNDTLMQFDTIAADTIKQNAAKEKS